MPRKTSNIGPSMFVEIATRQRYGHSGGTVEVSKILGVSLRDGESVSEGLRRTVFQALSQNLVEYTVKATHLPGSEGYKEGLSAQALQAAGKRLLESFHEHARTHPQDELTELAAAIPVQREATPAVEFEPTLLPVE